MVKKMKKPFKRALAACLAMSMSISMLVPYTALAAPSDPASVEGLHLSLQSSNATDVHPGDKITLNVTAYGDLGDTSPLYGGVVHVLYNTAQLNYLPDDSAFDDWGGDIYSYTSQQPASDDVSSGVMISSDANEKPQGLPLSEDLEHPTQVAHLTFEVKEDVTGSIPITFTSKNDFYLMDDTKVSSEMIFVENNASEFNSTIIPNGVSISPDTEQTIDVNKTLNFTASVSPDNAPQDVTWKSSNEEVASISEDGVLTALKAGSTQVTATTVDGTITSQPTTVNVHQPVESISITPNPAKVVVDSTKQLSVNYSPEDATPVGTVEWTSLNPEYATVDDQGVVTGVTLGTATIQATVDGKTATATVEVIEASAIGNIAISNNSDMTDTKNDNKTPLMQYEKLTFTGTVTDADAQEMPDESIVWSVSGNNSDETTIDPNTGVLLVAKDESAATLTITATAASDPNASFSETYKVYKFGDFTMDGKTNIADKNTFLKNKVAEPYLDLTRDGKCNIADKNTFLKIK